MAPIPKQVLILSATESLRRTRELLLTEAGFGVVSVSGTRDLEHVCRRSRFDLAIIGDAYEGEQKRRLAEIIRRHCPATPILEMCRISPEIQGAEYVLYGPEPIELVQTVKSALLPATKIAPEDPASRDEGPRLIPFTTDAATPELGFNAHYLELADIALSDKKAKRKPVGNKGKSP